MSKFKNSLPMWCLLSVGAFFASVSPAQASDVCGDTVSNHTTGAVEDVNGNKLCWTTENLFLEPTDMDAVALSCTTNDCVPIKSGKDSSTEEDDYALNPRGANYGHLYAYEAAEAACAALGDGEWRLPTADEWWDLGVNGNPFSGTYTGAYGNNYSVANNPTDNNRTYTGDGASIKDMLNITQFGGSYYEGVANGERYYSWEDDYQGWDYDVFWSSDAKYSPNSSLVYWSYYFFNESTQVRREGLGAGVDMNSVRCVRELSPVASVVSSSSTVGPANTTITLKVSATSEAGETLTYKLLDVDDEIVTFGNLSGEYAIFTVSNENLNEGDNEFEFYVSDSTGESEHTTVVMNVVFEFQPVVPIVTCDDNDTTTNRKPIWRWTGSDNGDGFFQFKLDNGSWINVSVAQMIPSSELSYGTHTLYVIEQFNGEWDYDTYGTKAVTIVESLSPDVVASPSSGEYSDENIEVILTAYTDENKTTKATNTLVEYKIGTGSWTEYSSKFKVLNGIAEGSSVTLKVRLDENDDNIKTFTYKRVASGEEDQTLNTHESEEKVEDVKKFSLEDSDVNKLIKITVDNDDEEDEVKLDLSKVATTASGKKKVTLTGDNEKLQIKRDSGISVEFDLRGTEISADEDWDGELIMPTVTDSPSDYGITSDEEIKKVIKLGNADEKINTSKAVRIIIPNEGDSMAMYYDESIGSGQWVDVPTCSSLGIDTQDEANSILGEDDDCYTEESGDMVIYTKHFSFFSTFISTVVSSSDDGDSSYSISTGILATVQKFADMLGGAGQRVTVASGLNLDDVMIVTRDGKKLTASEIVKEASGSAASKTNKLVSFAIGDTISTTSAGEMDIDLGGFTKMHIAANSKVTIDEAKNDQIIYAHEDGQIRYEFDKQDTDMSWEVQTKSVNAVIRGTILEVLVDNGEEIYDLIKGKIDIEDERTGDNYSLEAGQRLMVDEDGNVYMGNIDGELFLATTAEEVGQKYRRPVYFRDTPVGAWFTSAVMALKNNYIIKGYEGNYFKPSQAITRAEALKIVLMASEKEIQTNVSEDDLFDDVAKGDWYANYVVTADEENIVSGYQDGTFRPGYSITRAEALKIILKAKGITVGGGSEVGDYFSDVSASDWYASYVAYAYNNGIVSGYSDGTFRPNAPVTRAEFSLMVADVNDID